MSDKLLKMKDNYSYFKLKKSTIHYKMIKFMLIIIIVQKAIDIMLMTKCLHFLDKLLLTKIINQRMFILKYINNLNIILNL